LSLLTDFPGLDDDFIIDHRQTDVDFKLLYASTYRAVVFSKRR